MRFIHYYSGITIAIFMALHLFNHLLILHSEELHLRFMSWARKVYRHPVTEAVLFFAVAVQIATGIYLAIAKWSHKTDIFEQLQIVSGLYLAFFLTIHVRAVIRGRNKLKMDTNLYYGAGVMNTWPQKIFYIPYYFFALISFFFHIAAIHKMKMEKFVSSETASAQSIIIMGIGVLATVAIIYKMSNLKTVVRRSTFEDRAEMMQDFQ